MSITASYRRLSPQEFDRLRADPEAAASYFGYGLAEISDKDWEAWLNGYDEEGRYLDIDKDWHGLHFLLTGDASLDGEGDDPPPGNVVLGGTDTEWEASYGRVRYLTQGEVQAVADAFDKLDEAELKRRCDPAAFRAEDIYPGGQIWDEEGLEELLDTLAEVRRFFGDAAQAGDIVLLSID